MTLVFPVLGNTSFSSLLPTLTDNLQRKTVVNDKAGKQTAKPTEPNYAPMMERYLEEEDEFKEFLARPAEKNEQKRGASKKNTAVKTDTGTAGQGLGEHAGLPPKCAEGSLTDLDRRTLDMCLLSLRRSSWRISSLISQPDDALRFIS